MAISDSGEWTLFRRRIRKYLAVSMIVVVVASVFGVVGYFRWRFRTIGTLVPCVKTGQYQVGEILLRTTSVDSDVLLIAPINSRDALDMRVDGADPKPKRPSYRYAPRSGGLGSAGLDEWAQATGAVTYRYSVRDISMAPALFDFQTGTVSINGTPLRTAGAYALDVEESPDRKFVSVVSANGRKRQGSFLFFISAGGDPPGPYYHEIFDRATGIKVGGTYTLEYSGEGVALSYCWEAQGKYVVYHDGEGRFLWIVPGPNHSSAKAPLQHTSTGQQKQEKSDG